jgi:DNA processing protein
MTATWTVDALADPAASRPRPPGETSPAEVAALLVLMRTGRMAFNRYSDAIEDAGSARAVLERERRQSEPQTSFFSNLHENLNEEIGDSERDVRVWRTRGLRVVTLLDSSYPDNLRAAHDRPPMLFVGGRLKPADERAVAVIGSRAATPQGLKASERMAETLVGSGYAVVSGLAAGVDTAAHTAALRRGGRTVAVIGTGLSRCYPRSNVILQRRIAAQCAVVSQFLPDAPPSRQTFPQRNAVMSGMTLATVIVEASYRSGARIQARCALAQGRPVFLLESLLHQTWAQELAERPGVYVASEPAEIVDVLERLHSQALVA